jgi:guanine nucleotide-binding protein alpha-1 subunit
MHHYPPITRPHHRYWCSSIKKLLEVLQDEMDSVPQVKPSTPSLSVSRSSSSIRLPGTNLTDNHRRIRMRLSPLISMEAALARKLLPENFDPERSSRDICVRANSGWKTTLERATSPDARPGSSAKSGARRISSRPGTSDTRSRDDPTAVLVACKDDILLLWEDPIVKDVLKKHNVRLEDSPGL